MTEFHTPFASRDLFPTTEIIPSSNFVLQVEIVDLVLVRTSNMLGTEGVHSMHSAHSALDEDAGLHSVFETNAPIDALCARLHHIE